MDTIVIHFLFLSYILHRKPRVYAILPEVSFTIFPTHLIHPDKRSYPDELAKMNTFVEEATNTFVVQ